MKQIQIIVLCLIFTGFLIANNYSDNELEFMELMKVMENEDLVENFINNKSVVEAKIKEFNRDLDTDMIIITCDDFLYWFEQFAQIKKEEGVITVVVSTSTIGSTKGQIRNYLASQKQNNPNLQYVLLGGDENIIPAQNLNWIKSGEEIISSTDFYYSNVLSGWDEDMMELDLSPDLYVGRIPARNLSDVTKFYVKYQNYRYDYLDHTDDMAFVATNILKLPNITPDDNLVDSIIVHVDDNINIDCLHTYDLVDTLNGCAQSVINKLKDRDYSFFYGMWHGGDCYVIYDSEYNNYNDWWLNSFGTHRQDITINTNRVNEGSCWYSGPIDEGEHQGEYKYNYSRPALNYIQIEDEIPNINGNTYVAWISSCYTMDFFRDSWSIPVQRDTLDNIIQNYDITGNLFDYYVEAVPDTVFNVENCISKVLFNELGGPVALYATSTDDSPYFTKRVTQYYFDLQFDQYEHKLGNLTRDCWNIAENVLIYRNPRTIYLGYTLFGDPSMDVWCAEPDEFVIDAMDNTITAMNSQGIFEDGVTICVLDDNGVLKGRGLSPYTYTAGDIEDNWIITANKANFKQYKDTYLNSLVPVPQDVDVCVDSGSVTLDWDEVEFAVGYKIESSANPYSGYEEDTSGSFDSASWSASVNGDKRFYRVITERLLESTPSEVTGYVRYDCITTQGTNLNLIALPLAGKYSRVSDLGNSIGSCDMISRWNAEYQGWESSINMFGNWIPNFDLAVGNAYQISVSDSVQIYIEGSLPEPPVYSLITTTTTNLNIIMVPLNSTFTTVGEFGDDIGSAETISMWIPEYQAWQSSTKIWNMWIPDYPISIADPLMISVSENTVWPSRN